MPETWPVQRARLGEMADRTWYVHVEEDREALHEALRRLYVLPELLEAATTAADGLEADAVEIRGSWADFDGRDNLRTVRSWLEPLRTVLAKAQPEPSPDVDEEAK